MPVMTTMNGVYTISVGWQAGRSIHVNDQATSVEHLHLLILFLGIKSTTRPIAGRSERKLTFDVLDRCFKGASDRRQVTKSEE